MSVSDELLMQQFQAGSRDAFASLVERHRLHAVHFCTRMLGDPDMAEDLAQEGFARILLRPESWTGRARFTTYLFAILKNLCIDELRWRSRWRGESEAKTEAPDPAPLPQEQLEEAEQARWLKAALDQLPPEQRAALLLREYQQFSYQEIAEAMGWSESKTKVTIFRSRVALGKAYRAIEGGMTGAAR